jgi:acetamidase/formamidase
LRVSGNFPAQKAPILTVKSGETVRIDTGGGNRWQDKDALEWMKENQITLTPEQLQAVKEPFSQIVRLDLARKMGIFQPGIEVPLGPFMGVMGVLPADEEGPNRKSGPPGTFGGNLDCKELVAGTSLFLPVYHPGGLFFTGDARAENATHYMAFGLDPDLNKAMQMAIRETNTWLGELQGLDFAHAFTLSSIGVDFHVTQVVDDTKGIHSMIPKNLFVKDRPAPFWYVPGR